MRPLLLALLLGLLSACSPLFAGQPHYAPDAAPPAVVAPDPSSGLAPPPAAGSAGVVILPAGTTVTGLPYPKACTLGHSAAGKALPDPGCTPGAATSAVTQDNIHTTICVKGYSASIRAPQSATAPVKKAAMRAYGESSGVSATTELDHLVPLELGGSNDASNLWPQPSDMPGKGFTNTKDAVENNLHRAVCAGKVDLTVARTAIATDWTTAEHLAGLN